MSSDLYAVHVDLDAGGAAGAVIRKKNVFPRVVERQWLNRDHTNGDLSQVLVRSCAGFRFFLFGFRLRLCLCSLLFLFLCFQLFWRFVRCQVLLGEVLRSRIVKGLLCYKWLFSWGFLLFLLFGLRFFRCLMHERYGQCAVLVGGELP